MVLYGDVSRGTEVALMVTMVTVVRSTVVAEGKQNVLEINPVDGF